MSNGGQGLIEVTKLQQQIGNPDWVIFDCRFSLADKDYGSRAFQQGHIPGAHYADLEQHLSAPLGSGQKGRHPLPDVDALTQFLQGCGLGNDSRVVVYDDGNGAMAARLWWLLRYLGIESVFLLNGGYGAWQAAGAEVTQAQTDAAQPASPLMVKANLQMVVTAEDILEQLDSGRFTLLDARAGVRFRGEQEPIDPVAGHIPGAHCYPFEENLGRDGRFKSAAELRQRFSSLPSDSSETICYCGSGVTACHNLFALELAGFPVARLYPGSWSEWITDTSRPLATG
ncbi:sulfurtransferase [Aestuariirhabdus sp. LZHN29]|uniref:sulfurtransferase n=1 Tax=Aestuariirhabdus sp. LZHN29 TaxID=3417462 RepID=UPI003CF8B189